MTIRMGFFPEQSGTVYRGVQATLSFAFICLALTACSGNSNKPSQSSGGVQLSAVSGDLSSSAIPIKSPALSILGGDNAQGAGNAGQSFAPATSQNPTANIISNQTKFSSKTFGVAGSPRVTTSATVRKGGGRYHVGKPYTIRGVRYVPREDPNYKTVGLASWYGPNFHGRLTANGEVYDQFALSAAHPTMPLPSYAKVTNLENGASVVVRVNDRGPFSKGRVIDLSSRAAQLLGYTKKGVARVRVEYAGRAQMDGLDDPKLLATYNPGSLNPSHIPADARRVILASNTKAKPKRLPKPVLGRKTLRAFDNARLGNPSPTLSLTGLYSPKPKALINGYVPENATKAAVAIAQQTGLTMEAPVEGMNDLAQIRIAPIVSKAALFEISDLVSEFGPVSIVEEETSFAIQATISTDQVSALRGRLK
ncbi:MAG: septal ring lytic transglycosylase RlpA family protein [Pseudomonadota bacterium]